MSRQAFENEDFEVFVGADNTTGSFVQISDKRNGLYDEKDAPEVIIDNQGVRVEEEIPELTSLLDELETRYAGAKKGGNSYPNIGHEDVSRLMSVLGFTGHEEEVFGILD